MLRGAVQTDTLVLRPWGRFVDMPSLGSLRTESREEGIVRLMTGRGCRDCARRDLGESAADRCLEGRGYIEAFEVWKGPIHGRKWRLVHSMLALWGYTA